MIRYSDSAWIGGLDGYIRTDSVAREWPVSYHGTKDTFAKVIAAEGYDLDKGKRFRYGKGSKYSQLKQKIHSEIATGVYSTPDPSLAEKYAKTFEYQGAKYKVLVQNRVNMEDTEVIKVKFNDNHHKGQYFVTANENNIRPYGLLFKKAD